MIPVIIVALAIAFAILWLGVTFQRRSHVDREQQNVDILRQEFVDLKAQQDMGELTEEEYKQAYEELVVTLGNDLHQEPEKGTSLKIGQMPTLFGTFAILAILVPLLYYYLGTPKALDAHPAQTAQNVQAQQGGMNSAANIQGMVERLRQKLQKEPNNPQGWEMLGRSYMVLKQYDAAVDAMSHAYALESNNPKVLLMYADALAMQNGGVVNEKAFKLIKRVLDKNPNDPNAMWMAAMAYESQSDYKTAVSYWKKLLPMVKANNTDYNEVSMRLAHAESKLTGKPMQIPGTLPSTTQQQGQQTAANSSASVTAVIKLDTKYKKKVSPTETVFVFARAVNGPPMPLAVKRLQVKDLPATVTLDDSMAMTQAKMSDYPQVYIGARISHSGNAMPSSGDLQGQSAAVNTRTDKKTEVLIDHEVM